MSVPICRAQKQTFCRYHGVVHVDVEPETHAGLISIALSLTGRANGYQFGTDTGLDLGALTPAGTLTDEAVVAVSQQYGASIFGPESSVNKLGCDRIFNIAGIRKDIREAQRRLEIEAWLHADDLTVQRHQNVTLALQLWTSDAAHRISELAKESPATAGDSIPALPAQDRAANRTYIHKTQSRADLGRAFKTWFPKLAA